MDFIIEILGALVKTSPVLAVLIAWLLSLIKQNNKLEEKLNQLNQDLRHTEKENAKTLLKVNEILGEVSDDSSASWKDVINEIKHIKEIITIHLNKK